ncbi:MAG: alkene reductase [Bacteroidota bacterium]
MSRAIFDVYQLGDIDLKNRIAMAPMTRSRSIGNVPGELVATYYSQRAGAGLLITEGTAPSPNGLGYARIPGIFTEEQALGWKEVTDAVHAKGGKIFVQLMHTGRVSHPANMPEGSRVLAPSAIGLAQGEMWTDTEGNQPYPTPEAFTIDEIKSTIQEYVHAARLAVEVAGFDGVELHGANGYLIEQFIDPASNQRNDAYGGSIENRLRFPIEVAQAVVAAIGGNRVGIRLSPYGVFNEISIYDELDQTYELLSQKLSDLGLVYLHVVDHSPMGAPEVPNRIKEIFRTNFKQTLILSGGYDDQRAEADIAAGKADLIAIGRPWIANPDLIERFEKGAELAQPDHNSFYTPGEAGYTDYPTLAEAETA